jgi:hypothetical protein
MLWGVLVWIGLYRHTYKRFYDFEKNFGKKFGGVAFFVLPLAGWVGMSIEQDSLP